MATKLKETRRICVTGMKTPVTVPVWAKPYRPRAVTPRGLLASGEAPEITIVRAERPRRLLAHRGILDSLATLQERETQPSVILLEFTGEAPERMESVTEILKRFGHPMRVEIAWGAKHAATALAEADAKLTAVEHRAAYDTLGGVRAIVDATADLRAPSGRLSAKRIAEVFGLSESELAAALAVTRQALWKTPDSKRFQDLLRHFDRTARLRTVFRDDERFRAWLRMARESLDGATPLELLLGGEARVAGDLAEDMLTGSPT